MKSYRIVQKEGITWITFPLLSSMSEIVHFTTTRIGGISLPPQDSLNMGFVKTDTPDAVIENRKRLAQALEIPFERMLFSRQTHSNHVHHVECGDIGKGLLQKNTAIQDNDAFIVAEPQLVPVVLTADCVPIILYDIRQKIAAVIHAGWRGTVHKITSTVITEMVRMGCSPQYIYAAIGPSAGPCCYEVGKDVFDAFLYSFGNIATSFFSPHTPPYTLNLWKANEYLLICHGILPEHIETAELCTICNPHLFFSSRYNKGTTGRMASGIMIK